MKSTLTKLDTLINAAGRARAVAIRDEGKPECQQMLFASPAGLALVNAAFDLFGCDELYDLGETARRELGLFDESPSDRRAA